MTQRATAHPAIFEYRQEANMKHESQAAMGPGGNGAPVRNGSTGSGAQEAVAHEYHAFLDDVETLVSSAASMTAEELARAKAKIVDYVASARASARKTGSVMIDRARTGARVTDHYVREQPWQAVGITAVAGLLVGFLLGRRGS
jgi:ElaB/YqjD/DUF883 family membrane-anchored ribosome-binding protein